MLDYFAEYLDLEPRVIYEVRSPKPLPWNFFEACLVLEELVIQRSISPKDWDKRVLVEKIIKKPPTSKQGAKQGVTTYGSNSLISLWVGGLYLSLIAFFNTLYLNLLGIGKLSTFLTAIAILFASRLVTLSISASLLVVGFITYSTQDTTRTDLCQVLFCSKFYNLFLVKF